MKEYNEKIYNQLNELFLTDNVVDNFNYKLHRNELSEEEWTVAFRYVRKIRKEDTKKEMNFISTLTTLEDYLNYKEYFNAYYLLKSFFEIYNTLKS